MKELWQKNTVTIIAAYSLEFLSGLKSHGKKPGLMRITIDKGTPKEKLYKICPGVKCAVPIRAATELEKYPNIASVLEVK